jgi:hypothetical protein
MAAVRTGSLKTLAVTNIITEIRFYNLDFQTADFSHIKYKYILW